MAINTTLAGLSKTPASNGPDGATDSPATIDDAIRYALAFIAQLRDGEGYTTTFAHRNRLINGVFRLNQRAVSGTVVLAAGIYGHDRWKAGASGCTYTFSTTGLDTTITISAGSLIQVVEGLVIEGGDYVLSWSGTAQGKIGAGSYGATGTAATGVTANSNLNIEFNTGTITKTQLEPGTTASMFERRPMPIELQMCERYYEVADFRFQNFGASGGTVNWSIQFSTPKRAAPTVAYSGVSVTNASSPGAGSATTKSFSVSSTVTTGGAYVVAATYAATAEL